MNIQMIDLQQQYLRLKAEIDPAMQSVLDSCNFINGKQVKDFADQLATYLDVPHVIPCGNETDALIIALMALGLQPGAEVIIPAFSHASAAEAVTILGCVPVWVDVQPDTFNINVEQIERVISAKTKVIIPVHLFGQCCNMEPLMKIAKRYKLFVIEDLTQSIGAEYTFSDGTTCKAGTIGNLGITSFSPSRPLACFGDGAAVFTADADMAKRMTMISNHGSEKKYYHQILGFNSRLDTLQAAVLQVKLRYIEAFAKARCAVAACYNEAFAATPWITIPTISSFSSHIFHRYTILVDEEKRDGLQEYLKGKGIPTMVYYPYPLPKQPAFQYIERVPIKPETAINLSKTVLSLPIHTEMTAEQQGYIIQAVLEYGV